MKVYLVYGLESEDLCEGEEPFVKKVFHNEQDANNYVTKFVLGGKLTSRLISFWWVQEMEVE